MVEPIDTSKLGPIKIDARAPQIDAMIRVLEHTKANGNPAHYLAGINVGEAHAIAAKMRAMRDAMVEFVGRVDAGQVRSTRTYAKFKEILGLTHNPCGHTEPESDYREPETGKHRTARCEGEAGLVIRGTGHDSVTDGTIWMGSRRCPNNPKVEL